MQDESGEGAVHVEVPVVIQEHSFMNLFRKKLTRDRVVPIISASMSCLIFAMTVSGLSSFPKGAINSNTRPPASRWN